MRTRDQLRAYQEYLVRCVRDMPGVLLAVDMGLGKTAAVLTAVRWLLDSFTVTKVLVVAPKRVCTEVWPDEIREWEHTQCLSFTVIEGTIEQRRRRAQENTEIHIVGHSNIRWLYEHWGEKGWPYDMVVWDESSVLKAGRKRTAGTNKKTPRKDGLVMKPRMSQFGTMCRLRTITPRVVLMSGTPTPNGVHGLWGQIFCVDLGRRLGTTRTAFEQRWFTRSYDGYRLEPHEYAVSEITSRCRDVMVGLRSEDYLELPREVNNFIWVTLEKKDLSEYRRFERTLVSYEHDIEAFNRGVVTNKLLQFANGSMYREDQTVVPVHELKLQALGDVVEELEGANLLVAYAFRFDRDAIKKRFPKAVLFDEEKDAYQRWRRGEIQMLLAHPGSMGHGLNLQAGGNHLVWYGLPWSLEHYLQTNRRLRRSGQASAAVFHHHILAKHTLDETVLARLRMKDATQDTITDAVRRRVLTGEDTMTQAPEIFGMSFTARGAGSKEDYPELL